MVFRCLLAALCSLGILAGKSSADSPSMTISGTSQVSNDGTGDWWNGLGTWHLPAYNGVYVVSIQIQAYSGRPPSQGGFPQSPVGNPVTSSCTYTINYTNNNGQNGGGSGGMYESDGQWCASSPSNGGAYLRSGYWYVITPSINYTVYMGPPYNGYGPNQTYTSPSQATFYVQ